MSTARNQQGKTWVWMDGRLCNEEDAMVSVFDHGFLYGDSVYETLRSRGGRASLLEHHLDRLEGSAAAIELKLPLTREAFTDAVQQVIDARPSGFEAGVRLMVSRGVGPLGLDIEQCLHPKAILTGWPIKAGPHSHYEQGISVMVSSIRRNSPHALNPHIKSGNFLNNILAFREAQRQGAFEAVFLSTEGTVAECTTSNLFWVREGVVYSADSAGILLGVTRKTLLKIFQEHAIPYSLGAFPVEHLRAATEIFITSTLKGVLAVTTLDGNIVGSGKVGRLTAAIADHYEKLLA